MAEGDLLVEESPNPNLKFNGVSALEQGDVEIEEVEPDFSDPDGFVDDIDDDGELLLLAYHCFLLKGLSNTDLFTILSQSCSVTF